ncbi:MAG TPA: hypothetical protein PK726_01010 [Candidatus Cloacimonadota bacterium]|jgi:hypothetical protein|nr:hypothetical protein [Candidatus Cloacimonadota bacterium]
MTDSRGEVVRWCRGDVLMVDAALNKPPRPQNRVITAYRGPRRIGYDPVGWFEP